MKRDWDLLREQLLAIEEDKDFRTAVLGPAEGPSPTWANQTEQEFKDEWRAHLIQQERVMGHLQLLAEAGYIEGIRVIRLSSGEYGYQLTHPRLTMTGHEFLDTIRERGMWERIKATAKAKGLDLTADVIKTTAGAIVKSLLG